MKASCTFYGVGQGLCYGCRIADDSDRNLFRFVYDCGSYYKQDKKDLIQQIKRHRSWPKEKLEALFISHFDSDHISAVPTLLDVFEVEHVFIPYFSPEELRLLALSAEGGIEQLYALYEDPIAFFAEAGCRNLYIIYPEDEQSDPTDELREKHPLRENRDFAIRGNAFRDEGTKAPGGMTVARCRGELELLSFRTQWQFRIYQDQDKQTQKMLCDKILKLMPPFALDDSLKHLLGNKSLRDQAKAIYKTVKYGINQSSLVLYHAPSENYEARIQCCPVRCGACCHYCLEHRGGGTLLTGDLDLTRLKNKGADLESFVKACTHDIGVFQLPHHGSRRSMSINQLKKMLRPRCVLFPCSYGRGNRFRHPDPYMLNKVMTQLHGRVIHVVKDEDFHYEVFAREKKFT